MKAIRMICPNLRCRAVLSVPETARGKKVRCKACSARISVPLPAAEPVEAGEQAKPPKA